MADDNARSQSPLRRLAVLRWISVALPWVASLFFLFTMEHRGFWEVDGPYRGVISVVVLAMGLMLSFVVYSVIGDPEERAKK